MDFVMGITLLELKDSLEESVFLFRFVSGTVCESLVVPSNKMKANT